MEPSPAASNPQTSDKNLQSQTSNPVSQTPFNPQPVQPQVPPQPRPSGNLPKVALIMLIVVVLLAAAYFGFQLLKAKFQPQATSTPLPISTATPVPLSPSDENSPKVSKPAPESLVKSPLTVVGAVPPGWMNEGVFPIELDDSDGNTIVKGTAEETIPGSWQSGKWAEFTATLTFVTDAQEGSVVLMYDNPSGLPENSWSFEVPVKFNLTSPNPSPSGE